MDKSSNYLKKDDICGRGAVQDNIKNAVTMRGSLIFITGGRSVGKSILIKKVVESIGEGQKKAGLPDAYIPIVTVDGRWSRQQGPALSAVASGQASALATRAVHYHGDDGGVRSF